MIHLLINLLSGLTVLARDLFVLIYFTNKKNQDSSEHDVKNFLTFIFGINNGQKMDNRFFMGNQLGLPDYGNGFP